MEKNKKVDYLKETEKILKESQREKEKYTTTVLGMEFVVYPGVFSPKYFSDTSFFAKALPIRKGEYFLEMGCGTGIITVFAALREASRVIAIDINPLAVENTKANATLHHVSEKIIVLEGSIFEPLTKEDIFDTIFWNIPFISVEKENLTLIGQAIYDTNFKAFRRFIQESRKYLKKGGRLLLGFSVTIGDYQKFKAILDENNYKLSLIAEHTASQGNPEGVVNKYNIVTYQLFEAKP